MNFHPITRLGRHGFALVITVSLMVLLVVVSVGLLGLSAIALRNSGQLQAQAGARANARLALVMAIGELQKHTGADTRITAPSSIPEPGSPPILGAWRSWEGLDHEASGPAAGRPIQPDYPIKQLAEGDGNGRFLTWLISGARKGENIKTPSNLAFSNAAADGSTVPLLSSGSLGSNPGQVHVQPEMLAEESGAFAWWVSGENQKARLAQPHGPRANDAAGWADLGKSHATPDPSPFGLESLLDDPEAFDQDASSGKPGRKALSLRTTALLAANNPDKPHLSFHDLSSTAAGLLTNSATGGWRKDLSLLSEQWDQIHTRYPGGRLPLFRHLPAAGATSLAPKPSVASYDMPGSVFYPWSGYTQFGTNKYPMTYNTAAASWQSLVNFATQYKSVTYNTGAGTPSAPIGWSSRVSFRYHPGFAFTNQDFYGHYHQNELNPVLARVQLIIQAQAFPDPDPNNTNNKQNKHRINLRIVPLFVLWNPYNVEITKSAADPEFGISALRSTPLALSIINGTVPPTTGFEGNYKLLIPGDADGVDGNTGIVDTGIPTNYSSSYFTGLTSMTGWLPYQFKLKPGEAKLFAPQLDSARVGSDLAVYNGNFILKEGYAAGDNFGIPLGNPANVAISPNPANVIARFVKVPGRPNQDLYASDQVRFKVKADRLAKMFTNAITNQSGAGAYFAIGTTRWGDNRGRTLWEAGSTNTSPNHIRSVQTLNVDRDWAETYWPTDELVELSYPVSDLVPGGGNPPWTNLYTVSFGPRLTFGAAAGNTQNRPTKGLLQSSPFVNNSFSVPEKKPNYHPANTAYDISYHSMAINDSLSPEVGINGYIATGFQSGDGLSRLIMAEIPLRPMASLAELQSWNVRGNNPFPPFQYNLIGNSDATPMIRQNGILPDNPTTSDPAANLQHDDAYCANHLLFDDWFLSSIAPQPASFGNSISKDINTVYRDYLQGNSPLTNRAYRPIREDQNLSSPEASARISEILDSPGGDGWLKVASRIEVEGMFNVNTTSVKAWRALLGHARKQQIALHGANGVELDPASHDHVVSRHTVASNVKASDDTGLGAAFPSGSQYSGFRTLGESQLDELAQRIVDQVRLRGPFLSLSEFVNRQLGSDHDLALAGALQAALNSLTEDPNEALSNPSNGLSSETMAANDAKLNGAGYAFEKASEGVSTHGFPGFIRQADVLRPLAPVLSVRDDTFTIRAYGDARDASGKIIARAWCEAVVRRTRDFVDSQDPADSIAPRPARQTGTLAEDMSSRPSAG